MSTIERIKIRTLRNIAELSLAPDAGINLIYGENGSGKTSLLESIHILGLGRSFRSRHSAPVVQSGFSEAIVYGQIQHHGIQHSIGVSRAKGGETRIKIDGEAANLADLAVLTPIVVVAPESVELLTGGPKERRHFMDWGVFHVEPSFIDAWRHYQRALKQRNSLLRRGRIDRSELKIWDSHLCSSARAIDASRQSYLSRLKTHVTEVLARFSSRLGEISVEYLRGWPSGASLEESLESAMQRDIAFGRTHYGPHRADIRFALGALDAKDHLSRGQQKVMVCAMKLAQGKCLYELSGERSVYLVDDLHAELDTSNAELFCALLDALQTQVFITALSRDHIKRYWSDSSRLSMFHVEQGVVSQVAKL